MTRPRVLGVATYAELGGGEVLLCDVLAGVAATGIEVAMVVLGRGSVAARADELGIRTIVGPPVRMSRPGSVLRGVHALRAAVREVGPTVVHASNPKAQLLARLALPSGRTPITTQLLDPPPPGDLFARATSRLPGLRFAITDAAAAAWSAALRGREVRVIAPGIDRGRQRERAARGDALRAWTTAGLADATEHPRLVMVARLQRYKGHLDLLDAVDGVRPEHDVRVLLVGPDEPFEPGLRAELHRQIDGRSFDAIVGLAGELSTDDVAAVIADATMLVHPARIETFGLVVLEALASGTPVVAYAAAGPAMLLGRGGGLTVPVGDTAALGAAIGRVLDDVDLARSLSDAAVEAAAGFDGAHTVAAYAEAFRAASTRR